MIQNVENYFDYYSTGYVVGKQEKDEKQRITKRTKKKKLAVKKYGKEKRKG